MTVWSRFAQAVLTVWAAATLSFVGLALIPGDPITARLGPLARISDAQHARLAHELGIDRPLWQQYLDHLGRMLRGDFGFSYQQHLAVTEIIGQQFGHTVALAAAALCVTLLFVTLGQLVKRLGTAWGTRGPRAALVDTAQTLAVAVPSYWVGLGLLLLFAYTLRWLPSGSNDGLASLVLPATALAVPLSGVLGRVIDEELDTAERSAFALSSRVRGMGRAQFALRHGLRHTVPPVAALTTTLIGSILAGAVLIEHVFARQGIGRVALNAILHRDMPVVTALVVLSATVFAALGLLTDLVVRWADPRPEWSRA